MSSGLPNIVFILADDMGYGDVGCYGATKIPTPNMDRLASEGMRFTDAHSASAVCTPSRYGILTGRYCWRTRLTSGVLGGFGAPLITGTRRTVADLLRERGYTTAAIGKWHLGLDWRVQGGRRLSDVHGNDGGWNLDGFDVDYEHPFADGPLAHGFDTWFGIAGSLDMPPYCFLENNRPFGVPDREKAVLYNQQRMGPQTADWRDDQVDTTFAKRAVDYIEDCSQSQDRKPFFLYLTPSSPHRPCEVRPDFVVGASQAGDRGDMVVLFDWVVGQVMDALDRCGVAENTLLVVTSDNGARATCANGEDYGHRSNGRWRGQKADIWDGGHREPFIVRWANGVRAATVCDAPICLGDFAATVADVVESPLPADMGEDSHSYYPSLLDPRVVSRRPAIVHHSLDGMFSIRHEGWKLIEGLGSGGFSEPRREEPADGGPVGQLYDLASDPSEQSNVWAERPDVVNHLSSLLDGFHRSGRSVSH